MASRFFGPSLEEAFNKPLSENAKKAMILMQHHSDDRRHYPCNPDLFSSHICFEDTQHMSDKERARQIKVYGAKV